MPTVSAIKRKITRIPSKLSSFILTITAAPFVLLIRMLRPLILIRFGQFEIGRIGNSMLFDWYLCEKMATKQAKPSLDIFYYTTTTQRICNSQWVKMWKRILPQFPFGQFADAVNRINQKFPGYKEHVIGRYDKLPPDDAALNHILACKNSFLSFTREEEALGEMKLRELGIPKGNEFICFHSRDAAYLDKIVPGTDWSYHDYRDSDINNYVTAMENITKQGYYAVRMGAIVKKKIASADPAIIDYATNGKRTEFLDIYLGAKCRFFICSDVGISVIPEVFRRPIIYVNVTPIKRLGRWAYCALVIPKKFYSTREKRCLTFKEMSESDLASSGDGRVLRELGIELIENSPEEIMAITIEMDERLKGNWKTNMEDEILQQRFWDVMGSDRIRRDNFRIGAEYLRNNRDLLE